MHHSNLRSELRSRRRSLSNNQQLDAANQIADAFFQLNLHADKTQIGLYWPNDGEIDPRVLMERLIDTDKACFLPILDPEKENELCFGRYSSDSPMVKNRYGIEEPKTTEILDAQALDLILVPLVGFDQHGNRLGMGAGYYDRTLARSNTTAEKDTSTLILIGLAHHCQQVERIDAQPWDIPMHGILTDSEFIQIKAHLPRGHLT